MNKEQAYSPLKIFHQRKSLDLLRDGGQPNPTHVQLILSDLCNQSCGFCAYRWEGYTSNQHFGVLRDDGTVNNNPNRMLPKDKVFEILASCANLGVKAIQFTGGGEPTVHPDHIEIFKTALDMGFDVGLVTNGVIQRPGIMEAMIRMKWVRFSVDAGTKATYASLRKTAPENFAKVWSHIEDLCNHPDRDKSQLLVGVGFVVTKENWREMRSSAQKAWDVGADNFRISAVFQPDDENYFFGILNSCYDLAKETEKLSGPTFKVFNMFSDRIADLHAAHPDYSFCGYQHLTTYIGGDQNVYRCCNTSYNDLGLLGSLKHQTFEELWHSQEKRVKMEEFDARGCPRCQFNGKNKTIAYAIEQDPIHANFV
jgi:MoaA/NifB/PqqE/SkfB family radical SAM enzyme